MKVKIFLHITTIIVTSIFISCGTSLEEKGSPKYISEIKEWHGKRIEGLKKENGWLNLAGLFWLKPGENKFGSAKENDLVFPAGKAPKYIGKFILRDSVVVANINPDVIVKHNGERVKEIILNNDTQSNTTILELGSLRWFIIKRGDRYGIRLRDLNSPLLKNFPGIETYPINSDWKIEAQYYSYTPMKEIAVPNILGNVEIEKSPGYVIFKKDGVEFKLDLIDAGKSFFIIFADMTSGNETYGAGRFLYTDKADSNGKVILDFNKSYNPPCAFTKFATCPLPPKQNHLKIEITAGEKNFGGGDH